MTPAMIAAIVTGIRAGVPLALELAALAKAGDVLTEEQKARIDEAANAADVTWDERVAEARARIEAEGAE